MSTQIEAAVHDRKTGRLAVSVDKDPLDLLGVLIHDSIRCPGRFIATPYGWLYQHDDGKWGLPGLGYGAHTLVVRRHRGAETRNVLAGVWVLDPPSTLGSARVWPPEKLLPHLWDAGFRSEDDLTLGMAIAAGEGGFWEKARNWLPSSGFRPGGTAVGVQGPAAAWNHDHTAQGHSDRGLFQFNSRWFPHIPDEACDDRDQACHAMYSHVQRQGWGSWGWGDPWGHYSPFFDQPHRSFPAMRPLVQAFLEGRT